MKHEFVVTKYRSIGLEDKLTLYPARGVSFFLETNKKSYRVRVMEHKGWPPHIHLKKSNLYYDFNLKSGDKIIIDITKKKYRLEIVK
jgi:hypothetical protein